MQKQTVEFATIRKNGIITKIGRTGMDQPRTNFNGGSVRFYEDKRKQTDR